MQNGKLKKCKKCGETLPVSSFHKNIRSKDGYRARCKSCRKSYPEEDKDKVLARKKRYRQENKKSIAEYDRYYRKERLNKEKVRLYKKGYYQKNKDRLIKLNNKNASKLRLKCPVERCKCNLRSNIGSAFRKGGYTKRSKTFEILGCDYETFFEHLKVTFEVNYKIKWEDRFIDCLHIDHIIPMSQASNEESVYQLNYYTNLQFLYYEDNLEKSNNINWKLDLTKTNFYSKFNIEHTSTPSNTNE